MIQECVEKLAAELGITSLLQRRPLGLSGGERQRVALGRALSTSPRILCLDEPLSALDDDTHEEICELIKNIIAIHRVTTLHITHSRKEAERLADSIITLHDGRIEEPRDSDVQVTSG